MENLEKEQKKLWEQINFCEKELATILNLYDRFQEDLRRVRETQRLLYLNKSSIGLIPQLGDIEAEITYLRIREYGPENVFEISPASGWSTSWILNALRDNRQGFLYSFDLVDSSLKTISNKLSDNRWKLILGDVRKTIDEISVNIDYLFLDSDHSEEFANWYIDKLLVQLPQKTRVSVHDILKKTTDPGWGKESLILCSWLGKNKIPCATASLALREFGLNKIWEIRKELGLSPVIHPPFYNSMIFF